MPRFLAVVLALTLIATSCGDDADSDSSAGDVVAEEDATPSTTEPSPLTAPTTTQAPVESEAFPLSDAVCDDPGNMTTLLESPDADAALFSGEFRTEEIERMAAAPTDGPIYLFTATSYREFAEYPDGRNSDLTGRDAAELHDPSELLTAIGARTVYQADVDTQVDGDDIVWESITVVEYPCPIALLTVITHPDYRASAIHEAAGADKSVSIVANLLPIPPPADPDQSEAAFPPTAEDPSFDLIHLMDFHDIARYEPGANEPERTGREAWDMYQAVGTGASSQLGHYPTAVLEVQGVLSGDDRTFDQIAMVHMSSRAGFLALLNDNSRQDSRYHRYAALQNNYSMITYPALSQIPYAASGAEE